MREVKRAPTSFPQEPDLGSQLPVCIHLHARETCSASDWRSLLSSTSDTAIRTPAHHPARRTTSFFFVFLNTFIPQVNHGAVGVAWQLCPCSSEVRALSLFQGNYVKPGSLLEKQDQDLTALFLRLFSPSGCIAQPLPATL